MCKAPDQSSHTMSVQTSARHAEPLSPHWSGNHWAVIWGEFRPEVRHSSRAARADTCTTTPDQGPGGQRGKEDPLAAVPDPACAMLAAWRRLALNHSLSGFAGGSSQVAPQWSSASGKGRLGRSGQGQLQVTPLDIGRSLLPASACRFDPRSHPSEPSLAAEEATGPCVTAIGGFGSS